MSDLVEEVRAKLLQSARRMTQIPTEEMKALIRKECNSFEKWSKMLAGETRDIFLRNSAVCIYERCSELTRRKTGKHTYDMTRPIYRYSSIYKMVKLSDIVPHVVDTGY